VRRIQWPSGAWEMAGPIQIWDNTNGHKMIDTGTGQMLRRWDDSYGQNNTGE
jgi:hypothetical protein